MGRALVGVIGNGLEDDAHNELAEKAGRLLASSGVNLVNGGLGGVMRASARGCKEAGGLTIGLLPGSDPNDANEYIDVPIATGLGELRNFLIVRAASAVIAIGGGYGTLSEIALALKAGKPVIGLSTWDVSKDVFKASTPDEAVSIALKHIRKNPGCPVE